MRSAAGSPSRDGSRSSSASSPSRSPSPFRSRSARARPGPVTNYNVYVGGKGKANPKLAPVVVGAINTQGGQVLVGPGWTQGVKHRGPVREHATSAASRATRSWSATASRPPRRKKARSAASASRTTSGSRSSSSARSPSATSRSTPRSATGSRPSAASSCCRSTRAEDRLRALRDERLGARPVGHVRQERPQGEDGRGRLHEHSRDRLRGAGREGQPRVGRDQDDDGRLRCRTRPT